MGCLVWLCVYSFPSFLSLPVPVDRMAVCVVLFPVYRVAVSCGSRDWMWATLFYVRPNA
jgi:hypothetical protein